MRHVGPMPRVAARVLLLLVPPFFFLFAQLLLLILFYCFIIVVIDFVIGSTHFFLFTLTLSVTIKLFVINELNFSSTRLLFIALDTFSTSC